MDKEQPVLKVAANIALAALVVLLIGAAYCFRLRLFGDTSFIAFNIINKSTLTIQEHRYGSFITQLVPCVGAKLHLPIKAILFSYTISFNVFYCIAAYLLIRCRQYGLAVLMALFYFLFVTSSFYWPVNEINQAVAWMFLFFGVTFYLAEKQVNFIVLFVPFSILAFLTFFTHFVVIIPTTFLWLYFWLENKRWPFSKKRSFILTAVLAGVIVLKYLFVATKSYDSDALHKVTHFSIKDIAQSFFTPVIYTFLYRCILLYWPAIIVFFLGYKSLVKSKQRRPATWMLISLVGYFIIIGLTYGHLDRNFLLFHIESEWTCIGIIIATPFVFAYLPSIKPASAVWILAALFVIRLGYIANASDKFVVRNQYQERILSQMRKEHITKAAFYTNPEIHKKYMLEWTSGYESLFSSAMKKDDPQLFFCFVNKDDNTVLNTIRTQKRYWNAYVMMEPKDINDEYFKIDTVQEYKIMDINDFLK